MPAVPLGRNLQERARRPSPILRPITPAGAGLGCYGNVVDPGALRTTWLGQRVAIGLAQGGRRLAWLRMAGLGLILGLAPGLMPVRANVIFKNCVPIAGGGITCDTRPEGNTLMNDEAARYGLFDQASPGWDEFEPYQGYDDMFGGNET